MGVSVVILTYNCQSTLGSCLESVKWAEEIIALDGGSTDDTQRILADYGASVHPQPLDLIEAHIGNFNVARNAGFELAREDWILVVDADEEVSPALHEEILRTVAGSPEVAYLIPRTNLFWGQPTRVLAADFQLRLYPKGAAHYEGSEVDAKPVVSCPVEELTQPLVHHQGDSLRALLGKLHERTSQRARALHANPAVKREGAASLFYWHFRYYYRELGADNEGRLGIFLSGLFAAYPALTQCKLRWLDARDASGFRETRPS